jgi:hypothetical protein
MFFLYLLFIYLFITSREVPVQNESFKKLTLFTVLCNVLGSLHIGTCLAQWQLNFTNFGIVA